MTTIDFFREKAKRTGEEMIIGCPSCDASKWQVLVVNIGENVVISALRCANCNEVETVEGGVIDE